MPNYSIRSWFETADLKSIPKTDVVSYCKHIDRGGIKNSKKILGEAEVKEKEKEELD
jgi:hypothetical protein